MGRFFLNFLNALFGTPRRIMGTLVVVTLVIGFFNPNIIVVAIQNTIQAVMVATQPLFGPILVIIIMIIGIKMILGVFKGGRK